MGLGKKIALYCVDKNKNIKSYSYETINKKVNFFSSVLISKLKNKRISSCKLMIHASASLESSVAMLSCAKLGIHFSVIFEDLAPEAISTRVSIFKPDIFVSSFKKRFFKKNIYKKINYKKKLLFLFFEDQKSFFSKKISI